MKRLAFGIIALALLAPMMISAQTTTITKTVTTTAPTTGNPVAVYEWQTSVDNGTTWVSAGTSTGNSTGSSKALPLTLLTTVIVRVRGVDAEGAAGVWSEVSNPYKATLGAPGACGKPAWI